MRRAILIPPEEIRIRDAIRFSCPDASVVNKYHVVTFRVSNILGEGWNWIAVGHHLKHGGIEVVHLCNFSKEQPLELVRRLWPEGKTEKEMIENLTASASLVINRSSRPSEAWNKDIESLREAIDDYELGRPLPKPES